MKTYVLIAAVLIGIIGASFTVKTFQEKKPWPVPDNC